MQSSIVPVPVFPSQADTLVVDSFNSIPLNYRWALMKTNIVTPASAEVPAVGVEGKDGYIAAVPAVAKVTQLEMLTQGNGSLTVKQWDDWTKQADEPYVLSCVAANLGVKLA